MSPNNGNYFIAMITPQRQTLQARALDASLSKPEPISQSNWILIELLFNLLDSYVDCWLKIGAVAFLLRSQEVVWVVFLKLYFYVCKCEDGKADVLFSLMILPTLTFSLEKNLKQHLQQSPVIFTHFVVKFIECNCLLFKNTCRRLSSLLTWHLLHLLLQ